MANLSEREIWDDSALQNSWNEALEEYNRYHSIHARGEKPEEVLREFEGVSGVVNSENPSDDIAMKDHIDGQVETNEEESESIAPAFPPAASPSTTQPHKNKDDSTSRESNPPAMPPLPEHLIGAVHDDDLKKLLMSWYYSGYYTGLYEGKQAAARQANPTG